MKPVLLLAALVLGSACNSERVQRDSIAQVDYIVPSSWHSAKSATKTSATVVWTPEDNLRKESISIVSSPIDEALAKSGPSALGPLVARAQGALGQIPAPSVAPISNEHGLSGVEVQVDFTPPGQNTRYHRVHAALLDGSRVIHILYTAADPDSSLATLKLVIASLAHEEG